MKVVQNESKRWDIVDDDGVTIEGGYRTRSFAREALKKLNEQGVKEAIVAKNNADKEKVAEPEPDVVQVETPAPSLTPETVYEILEDVWVRSHYLRKVHMPQGLTASQDAVLRSLLVYGEQPQKDLCHSLRCTAGNMTLVIDNLQKSALVERKRCREDRRNILVSLTTQGKQMALRCQECYEEGVEHFFAGCANFTDEQMGTFADILIALSKTKA